jgi:hypothetical protein
MQSELFANSKSSGRDVLQCRVSSSSSSSLCTVKVQGAQVVLLLLLPVRQAYFGRHASLLLLGSLGLGYL